MPRYNIYYRQFSIIARDYVPHIQVVETDDIYHVIGKLICTSLEKIENIRYSQPRATQEECEALWREHGYRKYSGNLWSLEDPKNKDVEFEQPTEPIPIEPTRVMEMLCRITRQLRENENQMDWLVKGVLDASDEEYQYIYNYLPKDAEAE